MPRGAPTRRLATVLFTDIVGSTETATELGDERWRRLKARHHALVREELRRFRGHEVDTAGDGFLATFEEPTDAVRCAWAISGRMREIGLGVRAGVHTGGVEVTSAGVGGIAVHIAARIMALANGEEILVSATVRDLVAGSGIELEDRGEHDLKGIPGRWRALAVSSVVGERRPPPLDAGTAAALRSDASEPTPPRGRRARVPVFAAIGVVAVATVVVLLVLVRSEDQPPGPAPAANPGGVLLEIDPDTGDILQRVSTDEPAPLNLPADLAVEGGSIWMIRGSGGGFSGGESIARIDPETGDIASVIEIGDRLATQQVLVGGRAVWVLGFEPSESGTRLAQIDLTGEVLKRIEIGGASGVAGAIEGLDFPSGFAVGEDAVWVATLDGGLVRVDALSGEPTHEREVASSTTAVAVDDDVVWVLDGLADQLIPIDARTLAAERPLRLPSSAPELLTVGEGKLWTVDAGTGTLYRVDGESGSVAPFRVGTDPSDVTVGFGAVWVTNSGDGTISKIDPVTGPEEAIEVAGLAPGAIAVDEERGTLWVWAR